MFLIYINMQSFMQTAFDNKIKKNCLITTFYQSTSKEIMDIYKYRSNKY